VPTSTGSGASGPSSPNGYSRNENDEEEEEDDLVIVLNSASRRPIRSPSRRSSYATSTTGADESLGINGGGGGGREDSSSFIDEDDIPTIEFDSDPATRLQHLAHPPHQRAGEHSSDSQNGEDEEYHADYVGFLPGFLAKIRAKGPTSQLLDQTPSSFESDTAPSEDSTTPEAEGESLGHSFGQDDEEDDTVSFKDLAPPVPIAIPFHSTPPESLSTFIVTESATTDQSPPRSLPRLPLYHPFPIRPSQIALPPSPTLTPSPIPSP